MPKAPQQVIFVTVAGGVAYVCDDTVPPGVRVEIIDFDNLKESSGEYARLSKEARRYVNEHLS